MLLCKSKEVDYEFDMLCPLISVRWFVNNCQFVKTPVHYVVRISGPQDVSRSHL